MFIHVHTRGSAPVKRSAKFGRQKRTFCGEKAEKAVSQIKSDRLFFFINKVRNSLMAPPDIARFIVLICYSIFFFLPFDFFFRKKMELTILGGLRFNHLRMFFLSFRVWKLFLACHFCTIVHGSFARSGEYFGLTSTDIDGATSLHDPPNSICKKIGDS